jgi:hypothetical protein
MYIEAVMPSGSFLLQNVIATVQNGIKHTTKPVITIAIDRLERLSNIGKQLLKLALKIMVFSINKLRNNIK